MYAPHSHRGSPDGDAWRTAQQRRTAALRAWSAARRACRADAILASLLELGLGETGAVELDQLHRRPRRLEG
jgi:hypothetical protein